MMALVEVVPGQQFGGRADRRERAEFIEPAGVPRQVLAGRRAPNAAG